MSEKHKTNSIKNFFYYLENKRSVLQLEKKCNLVIIYELPYSEVVSNIRSYASVNMQDTFVVNETCYREDCLDEIQNLIIKSDIFILFEDRDGARRKESVFHQIENTISLNLDKFVSFQDIGTHFYEIYQQSPFELSKFNSELLELAKKTRVMRYEDSFGGYLDINLESTAKWSNFDGIRLPHLIPGEIAVASKKVNGTVSFSGTLLCLIPFAIKYGIIKHGDIRLTFRDSEVINIDGANKQLLQDLERHFARHKSNSEVQEVGLGTNKGIKKLYALNTVFEERHCGLHLGLGGNEKGSYHMDFIFGGGKIFFDNKIIYDGEYII